MSYIDDVINYNGYKDSSLRNFLMINILITSSLMLSFYISGSISKLSVLIIGITFILLNKELKQHWYLEMSILNFAILATVSCIFSLQ
jgi:hypothetical protein